MSHDDSRRWISLGAPRRGPEATVRVVRPAPWFVRKSPPDPPIRPSFVDRLFGGFTMPAMPHDRWEVFNGETKETVRGNLSHDAAAAIVLARAFSETGGNPMRFTFEGDDTTYIAQNGEFVPYEERFE